MNLAKLARQIIVSYLNNEEPKIPDLKKKKGVFCTLRKGGQLRGCIGLPYPKQELGEALVEAAIGSCNDPRFPPLDISELPDIEIEVSVLTEPKKTKLENIKPGRGVILKKNNRTSLFLPQVWGQFETKEEFLSALAAKAGLSPGSYKTAEFYTFSCEIYK